MVINRGHLSHMHLNVLALSVYEISRFA